MFRNKYDLCVAPNKYRLWIACPHRTTTSSTTSTTSTSTTTTSTTSTEDIFNPFMITIDTTKAGSANNTFILPTIGAGYDADIDWGDGGAIQNIVGTPGAVTHVYAASGTYQISISRIFPRIYFFGATDVLKLMTIDQWGDVVWSSMEFAFTGCANMTGTYTDTPSTFTVTSFMGMFYVCSSFNQNVNFDTSAAVNLSYMFANAPVFNQSVASFDTSNVTTMAWMFGNCRAFTQSVAHFDTSKVTSMYGMFRGCILFNQSVANFNTSIVTDFRSMFEACDIFNQSVSNFDTSSAHNMQSMFYIALVFNQSVANFNTSSVLSMQYMFNGCTNFNQSIATFDSSLSTTFERMFYNCPAFKQSLATLSLASATNIANMLYGSDINAPGTSTNYDDTLIAWAAADVPNSLTFHGGTSKYGDTGAVARASLITDDLWTITADGGHI